MSGRPSCSARADEKKSQRSKTLILSMFSEGRKNLRRASRILALQRVACVARARQDARCGGDARARTLDQAKMLVFLFRCSNPKAVFAIPAGTVRHRHSLMARRAAWRRSEGKLRRQRKRARKRRSAGRRSNDALLPVFDVERGR